MTSQLINPFSRREYKIAYCILNTLKLNRTDRSYLLSNADRILGDEDGKRGLFNLFKEAQAESYQQVIGRPFDSNISEELDEMMDRVFNILVESRFLFSLLKKHRKNNKVRV